MQPGTSLFRLITALFGFIYILLGGWAMINPTSAARTLLSTDGLNPSALSLLRFLSTLHASYGVVLLILSRIGSLHRNLILLTGSAVFIGAIMRIVGIVLDGAPNGVMLLTMAGELILGAYLLLVYRSDKPVIKRT